MTAISAYSANRIPAPIAAPAPAPTEASTTPPATTSPASRSLTGFDPTPVATPAVDGAAAAGGGEIGDALKSGVAKIAAWAQRGMAGIQQAIQGDMNANNGQVDPAKMQQYTMQMSNYELMNQMAAKLQEKEEAAMRVWLR